MPSVRTAVRRFWEWYQRHYLATLVITTAIFLLQIFHLYWLFSHVILEKLTGQSYFAFPQAGMVVYVLADYLEIPALVSASLLYVYELRQRVTARSIVYLLLLNTQWIHMLWITDEVVVSTFAQHSLITWNAAVAWVAILIDYLEVPVIVDTLPKVYAERTLLWRRIRLRFAGRPAAPIGRRSPPVPRVSPSGETGAVR